MVKKVAEERHKKVPMVQRAEEKHKVLRVQRVEEQHQRVEEEQQRRQKTREPSVHPVEDGSKT